QCVIDRGDEMAPGRVALIDKWNKRPKRIWCGQAELKRWTDSQRLAVERIVGTVLGSRVGIAAVLHAITKFVENLRSESGLECARVDEVTDSERIGSLDVGHWEATRSRLPAMVVVPGKCDLLLWSDIVVYARSRVVLIEIVVRIKGKAVAIKIVVRNLAGIFRNLVIRTEDRLRHWIKHCRQSLCSFQVQPIGRPQLIGCAIDDISVDASLRIRCRERDCRGHELRVVPVFEVDEEKQLLLPIANWNQRAAEIAAKFMVAIVETGQSLCV